ncbi:MAG: D-alanyl-D-alanine carboxypeptidase (penicillin-binding protein 5/6) [Lentisphaeria bacterium]|jgi:D-alanyl-D-alanine carboxypeptidase (penicillin-binding protein 5/6)
MWSTNELMGLRQHTVSKKCFLISRLEPKLGLGFLGKSVTLRAICRIATPRVTRSHQKVVFFKMLLKNIISPSTSGICALLISLLVSVTHVSAAQVIIPAAPELAANAYLLIDAATGKVIVESKSAESYPPASLTKMMTSYIVSEEILAGRLKESDLVRVSDEAWRRGGAKSGSSTMFLDPRSEVSVMDLLRGLIIQSGNDASIALAEHIAGNEAAFADVMNQQAELLGMKNTHFVNATGWPAEGHMTTAEDLAVLARALVNDHPSHYAIYSEKEFKYNGITQSNRNKLLFSDKTVDGIKTGHTNEAGYGLVASSARDGMRLISVVLGTKTGKQRANESQRLLAYGFRYFVTHKLYSASDILSTNRVWGGMHDSVTLGLRKDILATIPRGSHKNLLAETQIDKVIKAPLKKGQVLGSLKVSLEGETIIEQDLIAMSDVEEAGFFSRSWDSLLLIISGD